MRSLQRLTVALTSALFCLVASATTRKLVASPRYRHDSSPRVTRVDASLAWPRKLHDSTRPYCALELRPFFRFHCVLACPTIPEFTDAAELLSWGLLASFSLRGALSALWISPGCAYVLDPGCLSHCNQLTRR